MSPQKPSTLPLSRDFAAAARPPRRRPAPFSLRLSAEERALLEAQAGNQPLGAYIRERLFGAHATKRRAQRRPRIDDQQAARLLAELGQSRLSSNLNQLARHANTGSLEVSDDIEQELHDAYEAILVMRDALMTALGLRSGGKR
ncbi:MAG: hypothetical protein KDH88_11085 [Chromatiales bacterium]|nr:hypothetical protein [Chromatiales bacterium]